MLFSPKDASRSTAILGVLRGAAGPDLGQMQSRPIATRLCFREFDLDRQIPRSVNGGRI